LKGATVTEAKTKAEILGMMAKFRSRLDILWRLIIQISDGSIRTGQTIGHYQHYDTPLLPLIVKDLKEFNDKKKPTYEDAVKIAFETIMADFYRIEALIDESF
jgi:hypothetical protein